MTGLDRLNLSLFDTAPPASDPRPARPDYVVRIARTRSGHDILFCTRHPAPAEVLERGRREGLAVFTPPEIETFRDAHPEAVAAVIKIKVGLPGSEIVSSRSLKKKARR